MSTNIITFKKVKKTDLAYIAGLIDGEGCFIKYRYHNVRNGRPYTGITYRISIASTDRPVLEYTQKCLGVGLIIFQKRAHPHYKDCYRLDISCKKQISLFLPKCIPFLRIKKKEAIKMLAECSTPRQKHIKATSNTLLTQEATPNA